MLTHISKESQVNENVHALYLHRSGVDQSMPDDMKEAWKDIGQPPIAERLHRLSEALGRLAAQKYVRLSITVVVDQRHLCSQEGTSLEQAVEDIEKQLARYVADNVETAVSQMEGAQLMLEGYRQWAHALQAAKTILPEAPPEDEDPLVEEEDIPF
jgi:hypothetical protein